MTALTPDDASTVTEICRRLTDQSGDVTDLVGGEVQRLAPFHTALEQQALVDSVLARIQGLGELDTHLHDPDIDEVMVNAGRMIWIDRGGVLQPVGELDTDRVEHLIERVLAPLGRRIDRSSPIVDARLPSGARVCAVLPPVAVDGAALAIRRFNRTARPLAAFVDDDGIALLHELVQARCNIVVSGATSSGKTSLVAALLATVPASERLIVVEDTTELPIEHPHLVRLEARPAAIDGPPAIEVADLVRTALRLRPDRIVVGEVRGHEALALVQAMNTGHDGSISTCHANSPLDALLRLETLVLHASPSWPLHSIRLQLARSIDIVVHLERFGTDRRISAVSEVVEPHGAGEPMLHPLGNLNADGSFETVAAPTRTRR
jgi:pilus assembly protein CpaF